MCGQTLSGTVIEEQRSEYGMVWYGMVWYGMVWYGMVLDDYAMTTTTICQPTDRSS